MSRYLAFCVGTKAHRQPSDVEARGSSAQVTRGALEHTAVAVVALELGHELFQLGRSRLGKLFDVDDARLSQVYNFFFVLFSEIRRK